MFKTRWTIVFVNMKTTNRVLVTTYVCGYICINMQCI